MNLTGRAAVITGANQGLGEVIARTFVKAGASVFLAARGADRLRQVESELRVLADRPGQVVASLVADVSRPEDCTAVVARAVDAMGGLSILVNNAGVYGPLGLVEDNDWDEWVQAVQINLFGAVLMCRAVIPHFRAQKYGKVVNLSGGGATSPLPRMSSYAASKAALVRFTETLAVELREVNVDVNAIAPGMLNTRLLDEVLAAGPERVGSAFYSRALEQQKKGGVPLEKGASLAAFLASADSDGISGRLLAAVWDDWSSLPARKEWLAGTDVYTLRRIVPEDRQENKACA